MTVWYYADAQNNRHGPLTAAEFSALHAAGTLTAQTLVWREGLDAWVPWQQRMQEVIKTSLPPPAPVEVDSGQVSPYAPPKAPVHDDSEHVAGGHVVYAGFWKRVAASIIDSFVTTSLVYAVLIPLVMISGAGFGAFAGEPDAMAAGGGIVMVVFYLISLLIPLFYLTWMHSSGNQATLGKMAVGIKVTSGEGHRISFWLAFGRYFAYILSSLLLMIGLIMAAFTERKQALHDLMCNTLVVDKHAFTNTPERQNDGLGTIAITVLVLAGLLVVGMFALIVLAIAAIYAGGWR